MKNAIIFLLFFAACSTDPREAAIIAHAETDATGTRYELRTKVLHLEELTPVTARDSAEVYLEELHRRDSLTQVTASFAKRVGAPFQELEAIRQLKDNLRRQLQVYEANPDSVLLIPYRATIRQKLPIEKEFQRVYYFQQGEIVQVK